MTPLVMVGRLSGHGTATVDGSTGYEHDNYTMELGEF